MTPQDAVFHGTGGFAALVTWQSEGTPQRTLRALLAQLVEELRTDGRVRLLIGLRAEWWVGLRPDVLPRSVEGAPTFPETQADVLFQLAARDREALLFGLHRIATVFRGAGRCAEEILGGRIGIGLEAFGFKDGVEVPTRDQIEAEAVIAEGPLRGSTWILYLRFQQDLARFEALRDRRQLDVIGRGREGEEVPDAPDDAHVKRMRAAGYGSNRGLIRRGFPFRQSQEEGLVFVGISRSPERFSRALDAMLGRPGVDGPESLLRYAHSVSGGIYAAPPQEWFTDF